MMKKFLGILILGLLLQGCATSDKIISSGKVYKDMSKSELQDAFMFSLPGEDPFIPGGGSEFIVGNNIEILWGKSRNQFYVFKNVSEQNSCGIVLCKIGNGTLESWHSSLNDARDSIKSKTKIKAKSQKDTKSSKSKTTNKIKKTPSTPNDIQEKRRKLIDKFIGYNIIEKVEIPGSLPRVWVTTKFFMTTFSEKKTLMNLIYSYYYTKNPKYDIVRIFDNMTGKSIGSYSPIYGLKIKY